MEDIVSLGILLVEGEEVLHLSSAITRGAYAAARVGTSDRCKMTGLQRGLFEVMNDLDDVN